MLMIFIVLKARKAKWPENKITKEEEKKFKRLLIKEPYSLEMNPDEFLMPFPK